MVGCSVFSCVGPTSDLWVHCRHEHVRFCHSKKVNFIFFHRVVKLALFIAFFYILHGLEVFEAFCDFALVERACLLNYFSCCAQLRWLDTHGFLGSWLLCVCAEGVCDFASLGHG